MKVLVTGANGQLGSEIKAKASEFPNFKFLYTDVNELDLTDFEAVKLFFDREKPSFVINCAAYTAVDIAETDAELAKLINTKVPASLGKAAKSVNCKVVHISTDYVFDGLSCTPYSETDLVDPDSVYGKTKLNGEIALVKENSASMIIRTSWLYSAYGTNFVKTMVRLGQERDELKVVADQVGTPTHAADLANAIMMIIQQASANPEAWKAGIYHYSNEGVCSWYDFAKAILEFSNIECNICPITTEEYPTPAKRPAYSVLNKSKIKRNFGLRIPYWRDSLKVCIQQLEAQ